LPTPESDLARIVEVFDRHGVEYLIVGGHASRAYQKRDDVVLPPSGER